MDLTGKNVLVIGCGKSGIGAAVFLLREGAKPVLFDESEKLTEAEVRERLAEKTGELGVSAGEGAVKVVLGELPEEVKEGWYKQIPLRRGGTPEDVAKVALFLASDLSSYVSGQVIHCCGAMNC